MGDSEEAKKPGNAHDTAMRLLVEGDLSWIGGLLDVPVGAGPLMLAASFPSTTVTVDLLLRTAPDRLAHVEYQRVGTPDLVVRMLRYRALIMERFPGERLTQHVIVLGDRPVRGHDELERHGFLLELDVVRLRDQDPAAFLTGPGVAPLAVLGRGDAAQRVAVFTRAMDVIGADGGARTAELFDVAATLATIRLDRNIINKIVEEARVTYNIAAEIFRDSALGRELREMGREQGLEQGRESMLGVLLRDRFGDVGGVDEAAHRLAGWSDPAAAIRAVTGAPSLEDLLG